MWDVGVYIIYIPGKRHDWPVISAVIYLFWIIFRLCSGYKKRPLDGKTGFDDQHDQNTCRIAPALNLKHCFSLTLEVAPPLVIFF